MTYQQWLEDNAKYIDERDIYPWLETAFEAGAKHGTEQERAACILDVKLNTPRNGPDSTQNRMRDRILAAIEARGAQRQTEQIHQIDGADWPEPDTGFSKLGDLL